MIARIQPAPLRGSLDAIPSKSEAHRALICAALADAPTELHMGPGSEDIAATIRCLTALGAEIARAGDTLRVSPMGPPPARAEADCGESGSTLRFLLPVAAALGIDARFHMHGRLPQRPIAPLDQLLESGGCTLTRPEPDVLRVCGRLRPGRYALPGNVSSQFISGMLFALHLVEGKSVLGVEGRLESAGYVEMTLKALRTFGASPEAQPARFCIAGGKFHSPGTLRIGGDWSNAAFWLCADAFAGCEIHLKGLDADSAQGDRRVVDELARLRAASSGTCIVDAADIPDLIPALTACACGLRKPLEVIHAGRLRIKESDRLAAIARTLNALGAQIRETEDGLRVEASCAPAGGRVDAWGDHRIAMMAAIFSCVCSGTVEIAGAEAVNKSYPGFWRDFARLGGRVELTEGV